MVCWTVNTQLQGQKVKHSTSHPATAALTALVTLLLKWTDTYSSYSYIQQRTHCSSDKHYVTTDGNKMKEKENIFLCPDCLYDEMKT